MENMIWLVRKSWTAIFRNKKSWMLFFALPLLGVMVSFLINGQSVETALNIGILNQDGGHKVTLDTVKFVEELDHVTIHTVEPAELNDRVITGELDFAIVIKEGFAQSVSGGKPGDVQIVSVQGGSVTGYVKQYLNRYIANIAVIGQAAQGDPGQFDELYSHYKNRDFSISKEMLADTSTGKNMTIQTIGYLITIMLFSAATLSGIILKEKENRTYFRLLAAPVTARAYVLSNLIVNFAVMLLQIAVTLLVMKSVFHIHTGIPIWQMFLTLALFALVAVSLSLVMVASVKSSSAAQAMQNLLIVPTCIIAGCFIPVEIMPSAFQRIAGFLPQRWLLDTFSKLQQGSSFESIMLNILILLAFALVFSLIAVYLIRRSRDTRVFI